MAVDDLKKRTAARKAAGLIPAYPHARGPRDPGAAPARPPDPARKALPCVYLGDALPAKRDGPLKRWHECDHPDRPLGAEVCACKGCGARCKGYEADAGEPEFKRPAVGPDRITRIDPDRLTPVADGRRFNSSLIDFGGRRLMAYRAGWTGSRVHIADLGADLQPTATVPVGLSHPRCTMGQEDPRLFAFDGSLHLAFAGLEWARGRLVVSQMLARLDTDLRPVRVWEPRYPARTYPMEKNWQFFQGGGDLYAVYSVVPTHRVLKIDAAGGTAALAHETPTALPWRGGVVRGGGPPVRVGDEYYHWFHGWQRSKRKGTPHGDWYEYSVGVYTFDAEPPFAVRRMTPRPVWLGDATRLDLNVTRDKNVIYPCGAVLDGSRWLVSAGHQDAECVIGEFAAADIEKALEAVT